MTPIAKYPEYLIDLEGNVYSNITFKYLKPHLMPIGYPAYSLLNLKGKKVTVPQHRLLAETYLPNPENCREVNHIDGNKQNNTLSNLEWVHGFENIRHAFTSGLTSKKACIDYDKIDTYVAQLRVSGTWSSLSRQLGLSDCSTLRKLVKRDYERRGLAAEFQELTSIMCARNNCNNKRNSGNPAHNRKSVRIVGGKTFPSLKQLAEAIGASSPKVCVALKTGNPIKGVYLEYA